jgi:hypothetical protein
LRKGSSLLPHHGVTDEAIFDGDKAANDRYRHYVKAQKLRTHDRVTGLLQGKRTGTCSRWFA